MLSRFSSLKYIATNASKLFTARKITTASNLSGKGDASCDPCGPRKVAVVLCGCGGLDGNDPCEVISLAIHLYKNQLVPEFFAPNSYIPFRQNHCNRNKPDRCRSTERRFAMSEANRMVHRTGDTVKYLSHMCPEEYKALIIPGGSGVIGTLSETTFSGYGLTVIRELHELLVAFHNSGKPIGTISSAGILVASIFNKLTFTMGNRDIEPLSCMTYEAFVLARRMNVNLEYKNVLEVSRCLNYNVYSTPGMMKAWMAYYKVFAGVGNLVTAIEEAIARGRQ